MGLSIESSASGARAEQSVATPGLARLLGSSLEPQCRCSAQQPTRRPLLSNYILRIVVTRHHIVGGGSHIGTGRVRRPVVGQLGPQHGGKWLRSRGVGTTTTVVFHGSPDFVSRGESNELRLSNHC